LFLALQVFNGRDLPPTEVIIYSLVSFVIATTIHEFMHAFTALRLGDTTAQDLGRITLNPIAHFDPYGFFGMVMISIGYSFIGWGKPVPVNPNRLRPVIGHGVDGRKRSMAIVAIAGPVSNVIQAAVAAGALRLASETGTDLGQIGDFLFYYTFVNVLLASFNMIPVPPLDGHKILLGILPAFWYPVLAPLERYGFIILFVVFYLGSSLSRSLGQASIASELYTPMQNFLLRLLF
jgi:Zn-dependent protease